MYIEWLADPLTVLLRDLQSVTEIYNLHQQSKFISAHTVLA